MSNHLFADEATPRKGRTHRRSKPDGIDYAVVIAEQQPCDDAQYAKLCADFDRAGLPRPRRDLTCAELKAASSALAKRNLRGRHASL